MDYPWYKVEITVYGPPLEGKNYETSGQRYAQAFQTLDIEALVRFLNFQPQAAPKRLHRRKKQETTSDIAEKLILRGGVS